MADKPTSEKLAQIAFGTAMRQIITPEKQKIAAKTNESLKDGVIEKLIAAFEEAAQIDDSGNEFWDARDLQKLLDYADYRNFMNTVDKAKEACKTTGISVGDNFVDATEMVDIGSGATRPIETVRLSRYAAYLTAQNGDARKK